MNRPWLTNFLLAILAFSAATLAGLSIRRELLGGGGPPEWLRRSTVRDWQQLRETGTPLVTGDGSVTVVEFSDFQCPFCARVQPTLRELRARYPGRVRVQYRHFPLTIHPHAVAAAEASECAHEQGTFERYHDLLFAQQDSIGVKSWARFAEEARVPRIDRFESCVRERRYARRVQQDLQAAQELGLTSTPTLIVNGRIVRGAKPLSELEKHIRR